MNDALLMWKIVYWSHLTDTNLKELQKEFFYLLMKNKVNYVSKGTVRSRYKLNNL